MELQVKKGHVEVRRYSLRERLLGAFIALGLFYFTGCGTSREATLPPGSTLTQDTSALSVPERVCSDAANCREALRELREVTPESSCALRERLGVARSACLLGVAEGCTELGRAELWRAEAGDGAALHTARALFQRACEQGDGEGCARHALMTLLGQGVARDEAAGLAELQDACDKSPEVACGLGASGLGEDARRREVSPEHEVIALYAQRGCDAGDGLSCRVLGDAFREGHGVSQDLDKAIGLYQRACEAGNGTACAREGVLSLQFQGLPGAPRADDLFSRGCELGSSEACRMRVLMTLQQHGGEEDEAARQALFRQACDRGAAVGCLALYDVLRHKLPEPGVALQLPGLLKRACQFGETQSCEFLEALSRVSQEKCEAGSASACGVLGGLLVSTPALEFEAVEGMQLLHRACGAGDAASCELLRDATPRSDERTCRSP